MSTHKEIESLKKDFKKKFPYKGIIIEDNGRHYSLENIFDWTFTKAFTLGKQVGRKEMFDIVDNLQVVSPPQDLLKKANKDLIFGSGQMNMLLRAKLILSKELKT